ncbi:MAG: FAD:protein FMN transferase [Spirochaetaceae bacterium]|jgi:thiamine biosynthesis lipoprotein|nr:FAD:protein FMN transferase [Spirochaetaceae bacterium]
MLNKPRLTAAVLLIVFVFAACEKQAPQEQTEFIFGTLCRLRIPKGGNKVYQKVFARLHEIDAVFSANMAGTDIDRVNNKAGIEPVQVSGELIYVLNRALLFAELSGGRFDPTIGPLVKLWGIGTEEPRVPRQDEIEQALSLINWRDVLVDDERKTVFLKQKGMMLDLGAIAKGHAADEAVSIIRDAGVKSALIDFGGNIVAYGKKPPASPFSKPELWRIGVQFPDMERGEYIGAVAVQDSTLVTSGGYERFFEADGRRYHHILSTETGYPVENDILSVTIVLSLRQEGQDEYNDASMDADAFSTTLFAMGYEDGSAFISRFPDIEAVFVLKNGEIHATGALRDRFGLNHQTGNK